MRFVLTEKSISENIFSDFFSDDALFPYKGYEIIFFNKFFSIFKSHNYYYFSKPKSDFDINKTFIKIRANKYLGINMHIICDNNFCLIINNKKPLLSGLIAFNEISNYISERSRYDSYCNCNSFEVLKKNDTEIFHILVKNGLTI